MPFQVVAASPLGGEDRINAANPLGKIPALERATTAPTLYDSRVVTRFLDARYKAGLYPDSRIWEVLTLEATADGIMDAAVGIILRTPLSPRKRSSSSPGSTGNGPRSPARSTPLERQWMSHLSGPRDMGQIGVACALGYLDFRHGDRDWRAGRPALAGWYGTFARAPRRWWPRPPA